MRLIDAEYVLWKVQSEAFPQSVDFGQGRESVLDEIRNAPTVDAEPVVRCKDCFHFAPETEKFDAFCVHNSVPVDEDGMGFCSEGVKKTEILDDPKRLSDTGGE